ncbi:MAG: class I SAM-dependent methyltransferase [Methanomassiliicoccus sp.]|nr:class I SAM-dependent methyltransferase [Methanomassiliicoccus sp.]
MGSECRLCGSGTRKVFTALMMGKYEVDYERCDNCGMLQTEPPYWLEEAFSQGAVASDTYVMERCMAQSRAVSAIILAFLDRRARFVDYGGGLGLLTRAMRDRGFDFYWMDPFAENLVARGFEHDGSGRVEAVTAMEIFEHFAEPREDIGKVLEIADSVIFSTELLPERVPRPEDWWYYGLEHGQHICFYSRRTMEYIARDRGLHYYGCRDLHLLVPRPLDRVKLEIIRALPSSLVDIWNRLVLPSRTGPDMREMVERARIEQTEK